MARVWQGQNLNPGSLAPIHVLNHLPATGKVSDPAVTSMSGPRVLTSHKTALKILKLLKEHV